MTITIEIETPDVFVGTTEEIRRIIEDALTPSLVLIESITVRAE